MEEQNIENRPKCFGSMFNENENLRYGAMVCDEEFCRHSEKCWEASKKGVNLDEAAQLIKEYET